MCGICGVRLKSAAVDEGRLVRMRDLLTYRGPDDEGLFIEENIGFGHRRLNIIDLDTGHQPMMNHDESVIIIYNGEIYNYIELREDLIKDGRKFRTKSDTEVIIQLYEKYGFDCVDMLNGMFAFAIWNKNKKHLFIARDHFGIKPLYYKINNGDFIFASEIKAILEYEGTKAEPDYTAIYDYLTFQYVLEDKTFFKGIHKLLPAHYMVITEDDVKIEKYWEIKNKYDFAKSEEDFAGELYDLLRDSVRIQLRSDVPLGAHLSGGVDTGAAVCLSSALLDNKIKTFTAGFEEGGIYDDTHFARITSKYAGTEHFERFPDHNDFLDLFDKLIWHLDEPVAAPGLFPQYEVSKLASQNVKVVLGGQGSDETLGGYTRYFIIYLEQALKESISGSNTLHIPLQDIIKNLNQLKNYNPLLSFYFKENLFGEPDSRYFRLINRLENKDELVTKDFLNDVGDYSSFKTFSNIFNRYDDFELLNKILYFEMTAWLPALLQVEDRMSMACSLESRVPFLDKRIVELAFSMPSNIKFKDGATKYILRKALDGKMPKEILWRTDKLGFPVPIKEWSDSVLRTYIN
ncbi:MAG: asparagine synthase (glutamine-hydrolyzing), partial [bacterium]|nr:asparagine synthase (glutamine-hydrolyzing) [bacterium]